MKPSRTIDMFSSPSDVPSPRRGPKLPAAARTISMFDAGVLAPVAVNRKLTDLPPTSGLPLFQRAPSALPAMPTPELPPPPDMSVKRRGSGLALMLPTSRRKATNLPRFRGSAEGSKKIKQPPVMKPGKLARAATLRSAELAAKGKGLSEALELCRKKVDDLETKHAGCSCSAKRKPAQPATLGPRFF